ncbi:MAG TPA: hypothetical protein VFM59_04490, partial [Salinimicrobium sp.]|nr:hypothetical protein [Salinimicrobium sp.]
DAIFSKKFNTHWELEFSGKNLLDSEIQRVQKIRPSSTGIESTRVVRSYSRGRTLSLGFNYSF